MTHISCIDDFHESCRHCPRPVTAFWVIFFAVLEPPRDFLQVGFRAWIRLNWPSRDFRRRWVIRKCEHLKSIFRSIGNDPIFWIPKAKEFDGKDIKLISRVLVWGSKQAVLLKLGVINCRQIANRIIKRCSVQWLITPCQDSVYALFYVHVDGVALGQRERELACYDLPGNPFVIQYPGCQLASSVFTRYKIQKC